MLINKWVFESCWFRLDRLSKTLVFYFSFFNFDDFLTTFAKNLMKKWYVFTAGIKSSYKFLLSHKDLRFTDTYKMHYCHLLYWKLKLCKTPFSNYGPSKMVFHFLEFFTFSCFCGTFVKNFQFLIQIFKIHFKIYFFAKFYDLKPAVTKIGGLSI